MMNQANPGKLGKFASGIGKARQAGKDYRNNIKNQAKDQAKKQVKRVAKQAARSAAKSLAAETFGLSVVVVEAIIHWKIIIYIIAGIILFILLLLSGDAAGTSAGYLNQLAQQQQNQTNPLQVTITCTPAEIAVGKTSICTINVTYPGGADDIAVVATIYPKAEYVKGSANHNGIYNATSTTISWDAKQEKLPLINPINLTFTLTVKKTVDVQGVPITATANVSGGTAGTGGNVAANKSTCGGKYKLNSPLGNFGDPQCNFTKDQLHALIQQKDPKHLNDWYKIIIPLETGGTFNPNSFNPNSTSAKSSGTLGAFGLYQMNQAGKGSGQYDNGSVVWSQQTDNAIQYNNALIQKGCDFRYWSTAISAGISKGSC